MSVYDVTDALAAWAWRASWQAAILASVVALILWAAGRRLSPAWRFGLWGLVLLRLAMPAIVQVQWHWVRATQPPPGPVRELTEAEFAAALQQAATDAHATPKGSAALAEKRQLAATASKAPDPIPWPARIGRQAKPLAIALWLAGIALFSTRVLLASLRLSRAVRRTRPITDPRVLRLMDACRAQMRIRRAPEARELPAGAGPALVGFLCPKILLPAHVTSDTPDDQLRLIVLHELAHVRRRDVLVNWLATFVAILHWANPVVWLVMWRMRAERELACDEMVLRIGQPDGGRTYARTILDLVEALSASSSTGGGGSGRAPVAAAAAVPAGGAVGILDEGKAQLQRRLQMIARFDSTSRRWPAVAAVSLSLIVGALALSGATRAADPAGKKSHDAPGSGSLAHDTSSAKPKSQFSSPILDALLARPTPPSDDDLNRAKQELWKECEKKTIIVNGEVKNYDQVRGMYEAQAKALADAVDDAKRSGKWAAPAAAAARGGSPEGGTARAAGWNWTHTSPEDDAANDRTARKLKKTIDKVDFQGTGLADVFDFIRDIAAVDVMVEWRTLEAAGITRDAPVTLRLREPASVEAVLTLMFRSIGDPPLKFELDKGVVVVTTADRQAAQVTRVYDVTDLLAAGQSASAAVGPVGGGPGIAAPGTASPHGGDPAAFNQGDAPALIGLITTTVYPTEWMNAGGSIASISTFKTKLVIKAPEFIHKEVAELLEMLREKPAPNRTTATEKPR
jgi:beta-lactamase regulating signal transducer with metallopeptidase domain